MIVDSKSALTTHSSKINRDEMLKQNLKQKCNPKTAYNSTQTLAARFENFFPLQWIQPLFLVLVLFGPNDFSDNRFHIANRFDGIVHLYMFLNSVDVSISQALRAEDDLAFCCHLLVLKGDDCGCCKLRVWSGYQI